MYNLLSLQNLSCNAQFYHDEFVTPTSKQRVLGSFVRDVCCSVRSARTGARVSVVFQAQQPRQATVVFSNGTAHVVRQDTPEYVLQDLLRLRVHRRTASMNFPQLWWRLTAESTFSWPHAYKLRTNVRIWGPKDAWRAPVSPQ